MSKKAAYPWLQPYRTGLLPAKNEKHASMVQRIHRTLKRRRARLVLTQYAFLAPQLVLFIGLTIVPFIVAIPMLFTDQSMYNDPAIHPVGLANFTAVFTDATIQREYLAAFRRTIVLVMLNYATIYIYGMTLALLMYEVGFRGGFFTIVYLPLMLSGLAIGYMIVMLFSQETGTVNLMLLESGVIRKAIDVYSPEGAAFILAAFLGWRYAGYNMAIYLSGLLSIPVETIEASIVDGATYWQRLWNVYFPQMMPAFIIGTIACLIGSFTVFDELVAMGALYVNPEVKTLSVLFFTYGFQVKRLALGMTLSVETFVPLVIVGVLLQRLQRRLQQ